MNEATHRAIGKLQIAIGNKDWEIAKEAFGILDGLYNREVERPQIIPFQPRTLTQFKQHKGA